MPTEPVMIDISDRVGPGYRTRSLEQIIGIAVHHTVSGGDWGSLALDRTDEERVNHALAIDRWHTAPNNDWGGIGYTNLIFASGLITSHGEFTQQRAGVAYHNHELISFAFVGDFSSSVPTSAAMESAVWLCRSYRRMILKPDLPVKGHRHWVTDPAWATACPGNNYQAWLPSLVNAVEQQEEEPMPEGLTPDDIHKLINESLTITDIHARMNIAGGLHRCIEAALKGDWPAFYRLLAGIEDETRQKWHKEP